MTWQEASALAAVIGFMLSMGALGWHAASLLRSIDHKIDIAMVTIKRHDDLLESAQKSRHEMHQNIHDIQTWVQVHEKRHV